nr:MAG TPA: MqsA [Caudoviricetes sp.]
MESASKFVLAYNTAPNTIRGAYLADMAHVVYMGHVRSMRNKRETVVGGQMVRKCEMCGKAYLSNGEGFICPKCQEEKAAVIASAKAQKKEEKIKIIEPVGKHCSVCGEKFLDFTISHCQKYCSKKCAKIARHEQGKNKQRRKKHERVS